MHQKRLSASGGYPIKKGIKKRFVVCPRAGPHSKDSSMPLLSVLRDILKYCENAGESRKLIKSGKIIVDGKVRKDHKYPVGLFDVVSIPDIKESYAVVPGEKWLQLVKTKNNSKLCRIDNKVKVRKNKTQLNMHDGKNLLVDKDVYKTWDSVIVSLPELKISKHLKRGKGSLCLIIKGSNKGKIGKIKEIKKSLGSKPNMASVEINQKTVDIPEKLVFVIGENKPEIELSDKNE